MKLSKNKADNSSTQKIPDLMKNARKCLGKNSEIKKSY